jgi:hypothetical protein
MLNLTKKEKIKRLRKLMWLNFKENFFESIFVRRCYIIGLCQLYRKSCYDESFHINELKLEIPEILEFVNIKYTSYSMSGHWFPVEGFQSWWSRHWAIVRTIWKLKKL